MNTLINIETNTLNFSYASQNNPYKKWSSSNTSIKRTRWQIIQQI